MFYGANYNTLDAKGRLIIPKQFREQLGESFMMTKGLDGCLYVFPMSEWNSFEEKLAALPLTNKNARAVVRHFAAGAALCEMDKQGRILVPEVLRDFAHLQRDVVVEGSMKRIEIWSREQYDRQAMEFQHKPVMLNEVIDSLKIRPEGTYVDGTLGGAGHSSQIARRLSGEGRLFGFDQDAAAIEAAAKRLEPYKDRVSIIRSNYSEMRERLSELGVRSADGILLDLGVSSYQLDDAQRGFSYRADAPLDMRMDQRQKLSAREVVNGYSIGELTRVIREYGEERFARNIAKHITAEREKKPIETTGELISIIKAAIPAKAREGGGHPAKRTFQAIRIEVNRELDVLSDSLDGMIDLLADGGRICVITFHSLEDRIVKEVFRRNENPCTCPPEFPVCVCGKKSKGHVITRKPIIPSVEETEENPRSKSAKLRVFERTII